MESFKNATSALLFGSGAVDTFENAAMCKGWSSSGLWIRIRIHFPSRIRILNVDPGGENLREKMQGKLEFYYKILSKCGQTPLFINFEQSFLSISTLHKVICYKFC